MSPDEPYIDETADVSPDASIGDGTQIWNWTKIREGARIGRGCNIGQGVYVDAGVTIGDGCKIQNGAFIYRGVSIADQVFIGPGVVFTNDLFPRSWRPDWEVIATKVESGVSIGANATIVCGVVLGADCMVGAGSVVSKDVPPRALVIGVPARIKSYVEDVRPSE